MSSYITSNDNRLYAAAEAACGRVPAITASNRFPAVRFTAKQANVNPSRHDKTGTRTYLGIPAGSRRQTEFTLKTYLTTWTNTNNGPGYGPLFEAALGEPGQLNAGGIVASAAGTTVTFQNN